MKKKKNRRWRLIADPKVQGILCVRICGYWFASLLVVFGTMFGMAMLQGGTDQAQLVKTYFLPAGFVAILVLPVALLDAVKFSNRFAGPVLNLRKRMNTALNDRKVETVRFRKGDYWSELGNDFNRLCQSMKFKEDHESQEENSSRETVENTSVFPAASLRPTPNESFLSQ